jgi:hypothetical protein
MPPSKMLYFLLDECPLFTRELISVRYDFQELESAGNGQ